MLHGILLKRVPALVDDSIDQFGHRDVAEEMPAVDDDAFAVECAELTGLHVVLRVNLHNGTMLDRRQGIFHQLEEGQALDRQQLLPSPGRNRSISRSIVTASPTCRSVSARKDERSVMLPSLARVDTDCPGASAPPVMQRGCQPAGTPSASSRAAREISIGATASGSVPAAARIGRRNWPV